jgi:hypothetical protein
MGKEDMMNVRKDYDQSQINSSVSTPHPHFLTSKLKAPFILLLHAVHVSSQALRLQLANDDHGVCLYLFPRFHLPHSHEVGANTGNTMS